MLKQRKRAATPRNIRVTVRLSDGEYRRLTALAESVGMSRGALIWAAVESIEKKLDSHGLPVLGSQL